MTWAAVGKQNFNRSYTYDELNRIQSLTGTGGSCTGLSWSYDIWGNRTAQTVTSGTCTMSSLTFNTKNQISNANYVYDAAGNLTNYSGSGYTYDAESRLLTAGGVTGTYDGDGRRVKKSNGKLYWHGAGSSVMMETDLSGNLIDEYIYFGGQRVARRTSAGTVFYYFKDHLGSSRVMVQAGQTLPCYDADYLPFGYEKVYTDTCPQNYKFTGHERDGESGLDYMVARHYAFTLARFLQPDAPFADQSPANPQTWNLYPYARNNPLYFVDPTGQSVVGGPVGGGDAGKLPEVVGGCCDIFGPIYVQGWKSYWVAVFEEGSAVPVFVVSGLTSMSQVNEVRAALRTFMDAQSTQEGSQAGQRDFVLLLIGPPDDKQHKFGWTVFWMLKERTRENLSYAGMLAEKDMITQWERVGEKGEIKENPKATPSSPGVTDQVSFEPAPRNIYQEYHYRGNRLTLVFGRDPTTQKLITAPRVKIVVSPEKNGYSIRIEPYHGK